MKYILLLLFISTPAYANLFVLDDLQGRFATIIIDGKPISEGPDTERSQTVGEFNQSSVFYDLNRQPLNTLQFVLFTGYDPSGMGWYGHHSFIVFHEQGKLVESEGKLTFEFEGNVLYLDNYRFREIDFSTTIKATKHEDFYYIDLKHKSKTRGLNYHRTAVIKKL